MFTVCSPLLFFGLSNSGSCYFSTKILKPYNACPRTNLNLHERILTCSGQGAPSRARFHSDSGTPWDTVRLTAPMTRVWECSAGH